MQTQHHDAEQSKQFFDQWHLYQQVLVHDHMCHQGIRAALRRFVGRRMTEPIRLLDLGCGDASSIPVAFADAQLQAYTGIDLSAPALKKASETMAPLTPQIQLIAGDFSDYLKTCKAEQFNVILIGFALHHLHTAEKRDFFQQCYAALVPGGYLLLYDTFRRPKETRDAYLEAYCQQCKTTWTTFSAAALNHIYDHILTCDFPETYATMARMATDAGLQTPTTPLFTDREQFHCLYYFAKP